MTAFNTTLQNNETLSTAIALEAVLAELNNIQAEISRYGNKVVPMRLTMRKSQLLSLLNNLKAKKQQGIKTVSKKDNNSDFAIIVALVAMLIANRAQNQAKMKQQAQQLEHAQRQRRDAMRKRKMNAAFAPRLAA